MAQTNPLISLIANLQAGRSAGAARVFRAAPATSDVGQRRSAAAATYNADIAEAKIGSEGRKTEYDALIKSLTESVGGAKSAYEGLVPKLNQVVSSAKSAYETKLPEFTTAATGAKTAYDTAYTGAKTQAEQIAASHKTAMAAAQKTYNDYVSAIANANPTTSPQTLATMRAKRDAAKALLTSLPIQYNTDIAGVKSTATAAGDTYKTALDQINASAKSSFDTYQGTILDANTQQKSGYDAYTKAVSEANAQQRAGYDTYAGAENAVKTRFNQERNAIEGLGYLAQAAPTENSLSPSASSDLSEADIYSEDIATLMQGRKQQAQSTKATSPEDDLITGAMQSSLYSKG